MKRYFAIGGVALALVLVFAWVFSGGDRRDVRRAGSSRAKSGAPSLRWSSGDTEETRVPRAETGAVTGRVVDAIDGGPIAGATVTLRSASGEELDETSSEEDGAFSFDESGEAVLVAAAAPGYAIRAKDLEGEDGEATASITLELDGAVTVSGVVVDPAGEPVADVEVWIEDRERAFMRPPTVSATVRTDAAGRFAIEDSPSGTLIAHAVHPEYSSAEVELGALGPGRSKDGIRIELGDTGALSGRVVDESDAPIAGAAMRWVPYDRGRWGEPEITTVSGSDGRYRFPHLPAGRGAVQAETAAGDGAVETAIAIGGDTTEDVVVHRQPQFTGEVVDAAERPVAGAEVSIDLSWSDDGRNTALVRSQRRRGESWETVTDAKGRFSLSAPAEESVTIRARTATAAGSEDVEPGSGPVRITLVGMGVARVRVIGGDGQPFLGVARIEVEGGSRGAGERWGKKTDLRRGSVTFEGPPGEWRIRAVAGAAIDDADDRGDDDDEEPPLREGEIKVQVAAAPPETDVTIRLSASTPPRSTVRGRVVGPDGKPVVAARISVQAATRDWRGSTGARLDWGGAARSDASGRFAVQAPAGTQKLFVYHPEFRSEIATIVVPAEGEGDAGVIRLETGSGASAVYEFSGIGAVLSADDAGRCVIQDVVPDGPAQRAGLRAKDVILEIDGAALHGMSLGDAVGRIRGPIGTTVTLRIERPGNLEPFVIDVVRDKIRT